MAKCLITGGAGFIGSHLAASLLAEGHQVRVLDDFSSGKRTNLEGPGLLEIVNGSVTHLEAVQEAVAGVEWLFHLAAIASVQRSIEDPLTTHAVCGTGTLQVLEAARKAGVRRFVYAASASAYGSLSGGARVETDPVAPQSPYATAKLAGEHYCRAYHVVFGMETVCLRFFNVYGPRQDPRSPYSGVIALFCTAFLERRTPTIYGDGLQTRDFVYVADVVQALRSSAEAPNAAGQLFNIGSGRATSILDLARELNGLLGTSVQPAHGPARNGDVRHSLADISRARSTLRYEPATSLTEGLRQTLAWYQSHEVRGGRVSGPS